ncbi:hypothetical protein [Lolliginicoccus levis]|uniref:hypothetical protein n=1 Tax=Lolliginicoccus levis TaxID=2919542 RepID=UPI00241E9C7C|nr:hypothetical protein [Lolliginicoccus levis]
MDILALAATTDLLAQVPNPAPVQPPGSLPDFINTALGWTKWFGLIAGLGGLFAIAIMMMVGVRGRSDMAKSALGHAPWVFGGLAIIGGAAALIDAMGVV